MSNLYQISREFQLIAETLIESGGEVSPELEQSILINKEQLEEKAQGYGFVIKQMDAENNIIDAEIDRLESLKKSRSNSIKALKNNLINAMLIFEVDKIETPLMKIGLTKSKSVEVDNQNDLLPKFLRESTSVSPDKTKIKEAIESGEVVIGAHIQVNNGLKIK